METVVEFLTIQWRDFKFNLLVANIIKTNSTVYLLPRVFNRFLEKVCLIEPGHACYHYCNNLTSK